MTDSADGLEPHVELSQFSLDEKSVQLLGYKYCVQNHVVVLGKVDPKGTDAVTVGMLNPHNRRLVSDLMDFLRRPVNPVRLNAYELHKALDAGWPAHDDEERTAALTLTPAAELSFAPDTEVARILEEVLARAVQVRASDVHIETFRDDVDVRFRMDGVLRHVNTAISPANVRALVSRIKVLADLDIAERRLAQDGRITATFREGSAEKTVDLRVSVVPGPFGEDAVLRILDGSAPLLGLEKLGLPAELQRTLREIISNPEGMLLVTGPTGSGKTTTLYSALHHLASETRKILTVEDPVEYVLPKVNQKQVGPKMDFADHVRAFLRQNPDVILVGEIRDAETAEVAVRAAQTGHLVLSTLHTNDAVQTVSRLGVLGVHPNLLSGVLLGALAQRLVRRLCTACREPAVPTDDERARLGLSPDDHAFFRARGCAQCGGDGYRGRVGIYELMVVDDELADLIADNVPVHRLRIVATEKGMRSLAADALQKAREGLTSLAEILRVVPYRQLAGR
ncbi:MAG: GspE/PulE family protein [Myxococcota bacterium]